MTGISRPSEVQLTPLGLIIRLCEDLLNLSLHFPNLKTLGFPKSLLLRKAPFYETLSPTTDPLTIQVDIYIDLRTPFDMDA